MQSFGNDFKWSALMVKVLTKYPFFLDACAALGNRKGEQFMLEWGKIMTGCKPKKQFLKPKLAFPLVIEIMKQYKSRRKQKKASKAK